MDNNKNKNMCLPIEPLLYALCMPPSPRASNTPNYYCNARPFVQASIALIGGGYTYCSRRVESTNVQCDRKGCKVAQLTEGIVSVLSIPVRRFTPELLLLLLLQAFLGGRAKKTNRKPRVDTYVLCLELAIRWGGAIRVKPSW